MTETIIDKIKKIIIKSLIKVNKYYKIDNFLALKSKFSIEKTKNIQFGNLSTNVAMLAKINDKTPIEIGELIKKFIKHKSKFFAKIEIIKPGFINFFLGKKIIGKALSEINKKKNLYGQFKHKQDHYNIEFVSANPTGFIHIGHLRNGVYGDSLTRIWKKYGINVDKEYYVNDGGNQIKKLGLSVLIEYLNFFNKKYKIPSDGYHGAEIKDVARKLKEEHNDFFINTKFNSDKILDQEKGEKICNFAKNFFLNEIKKDLKNFDIAFDIWTYESSIYKHNLLSKLLVKLKEHLYKKDGALWLKTKEGGDDKDRVLIKSNGTYTYFAPDIAYHDLKLSRGYKKIFDIWGADHKSYANQMSIAIQLLNFKKNQLHVCIMQMVQLLKNGKELKISKRSGNSFNTKDIYSLFGKDVMRWYLCSQSLDSHIKIDVDKITKKTSENSLYYVQYCYVRIKQILNKAKIKLSKKYSLLNTKYEKVIISHLLFFKQTIKNIAENYEVHKMTNYLYTLAKIFHNYYENVIINDKNNIKISTQRLSLINNVAIIIKNGLNLLGINTMEQM